MGTVRSADHYDEIYERGQAYADPYWESVYYPAWMLVLAHIRNFGGSRVLDLGSGPGQFGEFLNAYEPSIIYFGIDFSPVAIQLASERLPNAVLQVADLQGGLPFQPAPGQVVVALEMLEHMENDLGLLASLTPGCPVVFSVPDFDWDSHVRHFRRSEDVRDRYQGIVEIQYLDEVKLAAGARLFVVAGRRSNWNEPHGD